MDGDISSKDKPLQVLAAQSETNIDELKSKLNEIINTGKDFEDNVVYAITILLRNKDPELLTLAVKVIAELTKYDRHRVSYAKKEIVNSIINILNVEIASERAELVKQCYRALGNLCCDCDEGRQVIYDSDMRVMIETAKKTMVDSGQLAEIPIYFSKFMLNFTLGGAEMCDRVDDLGIMDFLRLLLDRELRKNDMNDDMVHSTVLVISVIIEQLPEKEIDEESLLVLVDMLRETATLDISDSCLDILHMQIAHDNVKTLLAREGVVDLLMSRLELLVTQRAAGEMVADDAEVKALIKRACDLLVLILTGDDAMKMLYNHGLGESYRTMIRWLDCTDYNLLTTAVLALGNFARSDPYCVEMMRDKIYDKLLSLFEVYHGFSVRMSSDPDAVHPIDAATLSKIEHAVLSALRNLVVPPENKWVVAAIGRASPILLKALPKVEDRSVAYKLLATLRMLVDGQEGIAKQVAQAPAALAAVVRWGRAVEHAGAANEAPRLLAWTIKHTRSAPHSRYVIAVDGCVACLVSMLVSSHAVMQNEAIFSLTVLALAALPDDDDSSASNHDNFKRQLVEAEVGKHVVVLVDSNCTKMPVQVAQNLLAFLDITMRRFDCVGEYVAAKLQESIKKMMDSRNDFGEDMQRCINDLILLMQPNSGS